MTDLTAVALAPAPYRPRRFRQLGMWTAGPLRLKAYGITSSHGRPGPGQELQRAAVHHLHRLPPIAKAEGHHGLGFVVLHEGEQGTWLLMDWWAHTDICCQRLSHAEKGSTEFVPVDRPLLACVWESVILSFERNAWVSTMLTASPDPQAYLDTRLPDGAY